MRARSPADSRGAIVADAGDDLGSLRGKLEGTPGDELFLVLPREARALRSLLEFRILARLTDTLASEVVIVSGSAERRRMARAAGFRTRRNLWGLTHLLPPEQAARYRFRWWRFWGWFPALAALASFAPPLLALAVLLVLAALVPELRVTLVSPTQIDAAMLDLAVDPTLEQPDVTTRRLPGIMIEQRFEVEASVPTTGRARRPTGYARGSVLMVNSGNEILLVPQGLNLVTATGVRFVTEREARLLPGTLRGPRVPVVAVEPGPAGNVPALAITRLLDPGPLGLAVFNEQPTAGGSEEEYPEVAEADFATLRDELARLAREAGWQHVNALAGDDLSIVPDSLRVEPLTETFAPGLRVEAAEVTGRLQARATALGYSNASFNRLAMDAWAATLPEGYHPLDDRPSITVPEYLGLDGGAAHYRIGVQGRSAPVVDPDELAGRLRGASLDEASAALHDWGGLGGPMQVEMWPDWAPRALRLQLQVTRDE